MRKILRNNQIIITALCIMIAIVWYLNYTDSDVKSEPVAAVDGYDAYEAVGETLTENNTNLSELLDKENALALGDDYEFYDITSESAASDLLDSDLIAEDDLLTSDNTAENTSQEETSDVAETTHENEVVSVSDTGEIATVPETESSTPGEAVLASTTISSSYFSSAKLTREQNRAKEKETLMEMIENEALSEAVKQEAIDNMLELNKVMEKENSTELLLEAKGFDGAVVSIAEEDVEVVINAPTITEEQIAQIESIVKRKTGAEAKDIVISPVVVVE